MATEIERAFVRIKECFDRKDMEYITERGLSVFPTEYGLYGSSDLHHVLALFERISLSKRSAIVDLGSGDGRVALLASLFTKATGIEGDPTMHKHALAAKATLIEDIPQLERCELICTDYTTIDLSGFDTIFIFADHNWPKEFQEKLLRECRGTLLSRQDIFRPDLLKKGKTYWIEQTPFVSYPLNTEETL